VPGPAGAGGEDAAVAAPPHTTPGKSDDHKTQIVKCTELQVQKDWPQLDDCAAKLRTLGANKEAGEFQARAKQEMQNSISETDARGALRSGKLKEAQGLLQKIGSGSVYYKSLSDAFLKAENSQVNDARARALALATTHDCAALKRFAQSLAAGDTGTPRVVTTAQSIKCADKVAAAPPQETGSKTPTGATDPSPGSSAQNPSKPNICEAMNVDDIVAQAKNQFTAGFAKSALTAMTKALQCKQDTTMYRTAALYACVAHDAANAKLYYGKLQGQNQIQIVQRCQQEGITLP
jgi:hypothetical protein